MYINISEKRSKNLMTVMRLVARTGKMDWKTEVEERFKLFFILKGIQRNLQSHGFISKFGKAIGFIVSLYFYILTIMKLKKKKTFKVISIK